MVSLAQHTRSVKNGELGQSDAWVKDESESENRRWSSGTEGRLPLPEENEPRHETNPADAALDR